MSNQIKKAGLGGPKAEGRDLIAEGLNWQAP